MAAFFGPQLASTEAAPLPGPVSASIIGGLVLVASHTLWLGWQVVMAWRREKRAGYSTIAGSSRVFRDEPGLWILDGETGQVIRPPEGNRHS
jgi:hypothetical protein